MPQTAVVLINLGTPDSPSVSDVRKYLREFLMDGRVIDIPYWRRWLLVNLIIAPFRSPQSAKGYHEVWTKEGSPLKTYSQEQVVLLQQALGQDYHVVLGMRYQSPSIKSALDEIRGKGFKQLIVIPLYPQYASASNGSSIEEFMKQIKSWEVVPTLKIISQFLEDQGFINAFAAIGKEYLNKTKYDHIVFSYHGLPERQILTSSCNNYCRLGECCSVYHAKNQYCYRAQCFQTTRLLAKELAINEKDYTVCFQSRLGKEPWIKPYTDQKIKEFIQNGHKKILVFSPSFVADCLETNIEIGVEYKKVFMDLGGKQWDLVPSLNNHPLWIEALKMMVLNNSY